MSKKLSLKEKREVGVTFINFLSETKRQEETCKESIKCIYNSEFRGRDGIVSANFSSVIYALSISGKARVTRGEISFNSQRRRVVYADQHQMIQNKGGVTVWSEFDKGEGKIRVFLDPSERKSVPIYVKNEGSEAVTFVRCEMLRKFRVFTLKDVANVTSSQPLTLGSGEAYPIEVVCSMADSGYFPITLVFQFQDGSANSFHIIRFFSARVTSKLIEELKPTAPYKPYQLSIKRPTEEIVEEGTMPDSFSNFKLERDIRLEANKYPPVLFAAVKSGLQESRTLNPNVKLEVQRIK
ncbi:hypothetical protein scyTo_0015866 [Scyliorhinus torazame]|uniref:Uncharacterized protein n=1 Tax=Scyliorhinus torazame TaxID=75743 RepID=A0A401PZW8_SCYTO|nr:hypothetical protein [Scyliorhinus torazame]